MVADKQAGAVTLTLMVLLCLSGVSCDQKGQLTTLEGEITKLQAAFQDGNLALKGSNLPFLNDQYSINAKNILQTKMKPLLEAQMSNKAASFQAQQAPQLPHSPSNSTRYELESSSVNSFEKPSSRPHKQSPRKQNQLQRHFDEIQSINQISQSQISIQNSKQRGHSHADQSSTVQHIGRKSLQDLRKKRNEKPRRKMRRQQMQSSLSESSRDFRN